MTKSLSANQLQKIDRPYIQPVYFLHISTYWIYKGDSGLNSSAACSGTPVIANQYSADDWTEAGILPGDLFKFDDTGSWIAVQSVDSDDQVTLVSNGPVWEGGPYTFKREYTLYFSDRNFNYNGHDYEAYIQNLSDIEVQIRDLGGYDNRQLTLQFKNDRFRTYSYLSDFLDANPMTKQYLEIYKLMKDTGETFGSDVSTKIFKGIIGQTYDIDELGFKVDLCSMLFGKSASLPLDVISLNDYPSADPDDVGKYRNIIYGNVKKAVCPWTVAGWVSTLTASISNTANNVTMTDAVNSPTVPFTMIVDQEQIRVTAKSGNNFTSITRGYNNSNAASHDKGATGYESRNNFEVEVAMHPVKTIGDIYGRRAGMTEWIRITGGFTAYNNSSGRAKIVFTDKVKWEQSANYTLSQNNDTGSHLHDLAPAMIIEKTCIPTSASNASIIDNDLQTGHGNNAWSANYTETNYGVVNRQHHYVGLSGNPFTVNNQSIQGSGAFPPVFQRVTVTGGNWNDSTSITCSSNGGGTVYEVYKVVEYTPSNDTTDFHSAEGVDFMAQLSGDSVANMMIADEIAVDVEGYMDDTSGTYTGNNSALIERPDHVRKHILCALLGFNATNDIDATTFSSAGNNYAAQISGGYKFAFLVHDVAVETMDLFRQLDLQSRSNIFESQGKFKLVFNALSAPTSQKTFDANNVRGRFKFNKTEVADIRNKIRGFFLRDYTKEGNLGDKYQKVYELSNSSSIYKYGEMILDVEFSCIGNLETMVDDVMDAILAESKDLRKMVAFEAFWDAMILDGCDYFTVNGNLWPGTVFKTIRQTEDPSAQIIAMEGIESVIL